MDLLFSPYAVGTMPASAMAEIERRTEDLLKSSSFQRMLELEKKHKVQRLLGIQPFLPAAQLPAQHRGSPPPRPERPEPLFHQENYLMLRAARRTVILPSLSITIPNPPDNERRARVTETDVDEESDHQAGFETPTNNETFQKQVKFLAPGDSDNGEDGMSEQSSICQSPSWEGYGQRKKEKKLEAERRKKEKEQAEKEAKAAKKRNMVRLSKAPPPPAPPAMATSKRDPRTAGLTHADRSMSDPVLMTQHLAQATQSIHRPEDVGRAASADNLYQSRPQRPAVAEVLSTPDSYAMSARHGSSSTDQQSASLFMPKPEGQSPRGAFPPSASKTPMLRYMSPASNNRSSSFFQGSPIANRSQELLSAVPTVDGARRDGYVGYQRAQAAERALAGLADEQLMGATDRYYPPTSSSGHHQHSRRPSLTQEAKLAAMRLVGLKANQTPDNQIDYLTFKAVPYSASDVGSATPAESIPISPKDGDFTHPAAIPRRPTERVESSHHLERPSTSQSSVSSSGPSIAPSNHSKKSRTLRDAAKAALSMSKGSQKAQDGSRPPVSVPPYFALRNRMHSRASVHAESDTSHPPSRNTAVIAEPDTATATAVPGPTKSTGAKAQEGCRASEGSSSSSAYEDGTPLPSPTTTPDTSRPQSVKDAPLVMAELKKEDPDDSGLQDDERTLRLSLDSSKSSTPRINESGDGESHEMSHEDRWSRTALPIDIDCDTESFTVSASNLDNIDAVDQSSPKFPPSPHAMVEQLDVTAPEVQDSSLPMLSFNFDFGPSDLNHSLFIPPRSKRRESTTTHHMTVESVPTSPLQKRQEADDPMAISEEKQEARKMNESLEGSQSLAGSENRKGNLERYRRKPQQKQKRPRESETKAEPEASGGSDEAQLAIMDRAMVPQMVPGLRQDWGSESISSASSTGPSAASTSPAGSPLASEFQIPSNPYFADFPELPRDQKIPVEIPRSAGPPSPACSPSPLQLPSKPPIQPRSHSLPTPPSMSTTTSGASTPSTRMSGGMPVSILKQPKTSTPELPSPIPSSRPPQVLSALPKHMQLQAGIPIRPPAENRGAPIAKMFVECCSCKFYHDMPSKIYECMAKPDAVVEDRVLGISGAITTMVKCPWCQHNMSRNCCAGYAAVVYLKEKLH